ncbi:MAG: hypothetical protein WBN90_05755 [Gammaproteobacteria bacterium]
MSCDAFVGPNSFGQPAYDAFVGPNSFGQPAYHALRRGVMPRTIKSGASPRLPAVATFGWVMTMKHRWSNEFDPTG